MSTNAPRRIGRHRHPQGTADGDGAQAARKSRVTPARVLGLLGVLAILAIASFAAIILTLSRAKLVSDKVALAHVDLGQLGGKLIGVTATGPHGGAIPLKVSGGDITPARSVPAGSVLNVDVAVKRPGWIGWAIGSVKHEHLTIQAPTAKVTTRWTTVRSGGQLRVAFNGPVRRVAYGQPGHFHHVTLRTPLQKLALGKQAPAGTMVVAGVPRSWERLPKAQLVSWFPAGRTPSAVTDPAPDAQISPTQPIRLTFSQPVSKLMGKSRPAFAKAVPGKWRTVDSHTLLFTPSGMGFGLGSHVTLTLPKGAQIANAPATNSGTSQTADYTPGTATTTTIDDTTGTTGTTGAPSATTSSSGTQVNWTVPLGSTQRLHQLLAQLGYLPFTFDSRSAPVGMSTTAQLNAAVHPPAGTLNWRWSGFPSQLTSQWNPDSYNVLTKGALMAFESDNGLTADGVAGPDVWNALITAVQRHKTSSLDGYNYVLVHRDTSTQTATLYHDGQNIFSTPANTGVPSAPTELGTFPVFEHIAVTEMIGTNPDGSRYDDPGIRYVSYFNGGDALHAFNRASYGTPQSVGCVEMPEAAAGRIYPYTPIGVLVTVAP